MLVLQELRHYQEKCPVITPEKIDEWIKEVEERPSSAPVILQFIARRLQELASRNEELLSENVVLLTGERVEEYEQRIAHLEYQLELLKRHLSGDPAPDLRVKENDGDRVLEPQLDQEISLLVYNAQARLLRLEMSPVSVTDGKILGILKGDPSWEGEPARLLAVPSSEELFFVFTSGRVGTLPTSNISPSLPVSAAQLEQHELNWDLATVPLEPHAGENLACITPISRMAFFEFFLQTSRKGYVKKISTTMLQSILANQYIGAGVSQSADRAFSITLCRNEDRLILISQEGNLLCLNVKDLPFSIEEAMRLNPTDHLVGAFVDDPEKSILIMTQLGKIIHLANESLEVSEALKRKGRKILSAGRRKQGVQIVGAASVSEQGWGAALHQDGRISVHAIQELLGSGTVDTSSEITAFTTISALATE